MMKLSIEEKAKAYDKALAIARDFYNSTKYAKSHAEVKATYEAIFPVLAESKNERIRKGLIAIITSFENLYLQENYSLSKGETLAWLEKQGEPKEINPSEFDSQLNRLLGQFKSLPKEELASSLSFYLNVVQNDGTYKEEKQGEHDSIEEPNFFDDFRKTDSEVEPKFKVGDIIRLKDGDGLEWTVEKVFNNGYYTIVCADRDDFLLLDDNWELVEQKHWNEEDEDMINSIIRELIHQYNEEIPQGTEDKIKWLKNKLKSLRPQNWTKEDKERYISCLQKLSTGNPEQPETINSKWFKEHVYSKPQSTWRPSDRQIEILKDFLFHIPIEVPEKVVLVSLYHDLLKLKE